MDKYPYVDDIMCVTVCVLTMTVSAQHTLVINEQLLIIQHYSAHV